MAGIGLLGVLATHALSVWQARQRIDWETRNKKDDRAHESHVWLREQRLSLYGEFITLTARGDRVLRDIGRHSFTPKEKERSAESLEKLRTALQYFEEITGRIHVIASYQIATLALKLENEIRRSYALLMSVIVDQISVDDWEEKNSAVVDKFAETRDALLDAIRTELGTPAA